MCGINGFNFVDKRLISLMNNAIKHRGPDDKGIFCDNDVSLGHVRLSILDLNEKGHQPMFYSKDSGCSSDKHKKGLLKDSKVTIVFNGEIYNYLELRTELEKKG
ncbi:MAG: asparagine synthetase B, partial [Nanoarchaeota archaeon]|nr:asparagine synthetase B [Nanoarchaeota archaeon]